MDSNNLYNGIFYCVDCGKPRHIIRIQKHQKCECGSRSYISHLNVDLKEIYHHE